VLVYLGDADMLELSARRAEASVAAPIRRRPPYVAARSQIRRSAASPLGFRRRLSRVAAAPRRRSSTSPHMSRQRRGSSPLAPTTFDLGPPPLCAKDCVVLRR
jgi:hypothetical protein